MALIVPEQSQRPYRFGMTLLCIGALFNWLGLADSYTEPVPAVRYIGVGLIAVGAALICLAMCCWMRAVQDPLVAREMHNRENVGVQVINVDEPDPRSLEKPPDYSSVVDFPPSYEDAVKELDANKLLYPTLNNYPDSIKKEDDIVLIISQIDGINREVENQESAAQKQSDDEKEVAKYTDAKMSDNIKASDNTKLSENTANGTVEKLEANQSTLRTHSIVEIPESMDNISETNKSDTKSHSTVDIGGSNPNIESAISVNLVSDESSKSNSIAKVFRKSFRSLRKATLPSTDSEVISKSASCDIHASGEEHR